MENKNSTVYFLAIRLIENSQALSSFVNFVDNSNSADFCKCSELQIECPHSTSTHRERSLRFICGKKKNWIKKMIRILKSFKTTLNLLLFLLLNNWSPLTPTKLSESLFVVQFALARVLGVLSIRKAHSWLEIWVCAIILNI